MIAAVFATIWYELFYSSALPTLAHGIVVALVLVTGHPTGRRAVLVGLLLGRQCCAPSAIRRACGCTVGARGGWVGGAKPSSGRHTINLASWSARIRKPNAKRDMHIG